VDDWWMTGGAVIDNIQPTTTTTFVDLTGTSPGPDLPIAIGFHCLLSLNDRIIFLIGRLLGNDTRSKATFYYNTKDETWTDPHVSNFDRTRCLAGCEEIIYLGPGRLR
jgi:hypothetical protein